MNEHSNIAAWAIGWRNRAIQAETQGKELVVLEMPKNGLYELIERMMQETFGINQVVVSDPDTLFSGHTVEIEMFKKLLTGNK